MCFHGDIFSLFKDVLKCSGTVIGKAWLFFGYHHPDKDNMYKYVCNSVLLENNVYETCYSFNVERSKVLFEFRSFCSPPYLILLSGT